MLDLDFDPVRRRRWFRSPRWLPAIAAAAVAGLLSGCGGGTDTNAGGTHFTSDSGPTITMQPVSATVASGSAATFSVAATGSPTPTYQWQSSLDGGATFQAIAGATATTYTTLITSQSDSGTLVDVVVTNSAGSVTSSSAVLTVTPPPA